MPLKDFSPFRLKQFASYSRFDNNQVPIVRRLLHKGLPLSCGVTYIRLRPFNTAVDQQLILPLASHPILSTMAMMPIGDFDALQHLRRIHSRRLCHLSNGGSSV
jgi:hypothetical protein